MDRATAVKVLEFGELAQRAFNRRRRVSLAVFLGLLFLQAMKYLAPDSPTWHRTALWDMVSAFLMAGILIWLYRCPVCGGGIKLDGVTCNSCGRTFARR